VVFHNTLASSEYGLLDQNSFEPRSNYWAALLWRRFMGSTVLDAGPLESQLHLYAHCWRGHPGGVTLLAINLSRTETKSLELPNSADRYTLSAPVGHGDAPVLSEVVETPRSQDRMPRCAIPLALTPATVPYRASGLVVWVISDGTMKESATEAVLFRSCLRLAWRAKSRSTPAFP